MAHTGVSGGELDGAFTAPAAPTAATATVPTDPPAPAPAPAANRLSFKSLLTSILKPRHQTEAPSSQPPEPPTKDAVEPPETPTEPSTGFEGSLSLPIMADSFRRFNARCDVLPH